MAYQNFIPNVWSAKIQTERERACVAASLCYREFEGEIKDAGDTVKIVGIGRPTIGTYSKDTTTITPENLNDYSTQLKIDKADYFCFEVDDIDKVQAKGNIMEAQMKEAAAAMAESMDTYIYGKYGEAGTTITQASLTSGNMLSTITSAAKALWANNVPKTEDIYLEVTPDIYEKMILAKILKEQPNGEIIKNGYIGDLVGFKVYMSNGIYKSGSASYCIARTKKAIALADQFSKVEAFRPQSSFSDAVKGLHLYGAKVIRPKELVTLVLTPAAETTI